MKRVGNLYERICSTENLLLADKRARRGKRKKQRQIRAFDLDRDVNIFMLRDMLLNKWYKTSQYKTFKVYEPKERLVFQLPYYPDRITHHAVMNVLEPIFVAMFTADTYSCIKGKGIHGAAKGVKRALKDREGTKYCLKLDIKKFYPTVNHDILKALLRKKFKDNDLLWLLDEVIDSAPGLPIGNYLSQYFANFFLCYFDHWIKEVKGVKYYFRYADDLVIFADNKPYLHELLAGITDYLEVNLNLIVKANYQIFPVEKRGVDFVGYRFYHTHTLLRKRIKQRFARMMAKNRNPKSLASYRGWSNHCNSYKMLKKFTHEKFQRIKYRTRSRERSIYRKKEGYGRNNRSGDNNPRLQSAAV